MQAQEKESSFSYRGALTAAMRHLALDPKVVFIGQGVACSGTFMSETMERVPMDRRIEFPVAEEMQLGASIGMALDGLIPVSVFPRWNFLILAANQLVNHLDKMRPHVIVRVGVGSTKPLDPGPQHKGDFTDAFRLMMPNTHIERLDHAEQIIPAYRAALERDSPSILVEVADLYSAA